MKRGLNFPDKKGLSTVVATLIIILLVLVAVGIVWTVIQRVLVSGSAQIELDQKCRDISFRNVGVSPGETAGVYLVTLDRSSSGGEIGGVRLNFFNSAGDNSGILEFGATMNALDSKTQTIDTSLGTQLTAANKFEITPYFVDSLGNEQACPQTLSYSLGTAGAVQVGGEGSGTVVEGGSCTLDSECQSGLSCVAGTCTAGSPPGTPCTLDSECQFGYSCDTEAGTCSETCSYSPVESICTLEGPYSCGTVTVCGQQVDCSVELGECSVGTYCNSNLCSADTILNQGTVGEVFTLSSPFTFTSDDLPTLQTLLQGKYINFTGGTTCDVISSHLQTDNVIYLRLGLVDPTLQTSAEYTVWQNSECSNYF